MRHTIRFSDGLTVSYSLGAELQEVGDRVVPTPIFVSDPGHVSEPGLKMKIEVRQGIPVYTEVSLKARPDGPDVRMKDLKLPLDSWLEQVVAACSASVAATDGSGRWTTAVQRPWEADRTSAIANVRRTRKGRPRSSPELQKVADVYRQHIHDRPTEAVARAFGKQHRTAARYVQQAREAGLLPSTTPGKKRA